MRSMHAALPQAPEKLQALVRDFLVESQDELQDTREACVAWAEAHYAGLLDGTIGGNLLSKYSMLGRFYLTSECLTFLEQVIVGHDQARKIQPEHRQAVFGYLKAALLGVPFREAMKGSVECDARFDVGEWAEENYSKPLDAYRLPSKTRLVGAVPDDVRTEITAKIDTFGEHPAGLGKFTRTMFARTLRRVFERVTAGEDAPAQSAEDRATP